MKFTEEKLELAFIESLGNEEFEYRSGAQIRDVSHSILNEPKGSYSSADSEVLIKSECHVCWLYGHTNRCNAQCFWGGY